MYLKPINTKFEVQLAYEVERQLDNKRRVKLDGLFLPYEKFKSNVKQCLIYSKEEEEILIFKDGLALKGPDIKTLIDRIEQIAKILDINLSVNRNRAKLEYKVKYSNYDNNLSLSDQLDYLNKFIEPKENLLVTGLKYSEPIDYHQEKYLLEVKLDINKKYISISGRTLSKYEQIEGVISKVLDYFYNNFETNGEYNYEKKCCVGDYKNE